MPIFFRNTPLQEPFTLESAGFDWHQEPWDRPDGYPLYHYLQTEQGCGSFTACGRTYLLTEGDGLLIAPFVPHSYHAEGADWITTFVTFTGTLSDTFPSLIQDKVRFFPSSDTGTIRELIREGADLMAASPLLCRSQVTTSCSYFLTKTAAILPRIILCTSPISHLPCS